MRYFLTLLFISTIILPFSAIPAHAIYLDERLGVTNSCGVYPDRTSQGDYLQYGVQKTRELGFAGLELIMVPRSLCSSGGGCYQQATQYCSGNKLDVPDMRGMMTLPQYQIAMSKPIKYFTLFVEAVKSTSLQQASIHASSEPYTQAEIDSTYKEVKDAIKYLLTRYRGSGKTFYIAPVNELDNRLVQSSGCLLNFPCDDVDVPAYSINHAINFLNTYARAIKDAKEEIPPEGVTVYLTCEINRVISRSMRGKTSAANDVIPHTQCDIVAYSAYETIMASNPSGVRQNMLESLNYIADKAPDHSDFPNGKNVMIGEIGYPENSTRTDVSFDKAAAAIQAAMDWGVVRLNIWTLLDQKCTKANPTNADCSGFWMIKPDGSRSQMYNYLRTTYSTTAPSLPPTNSADLNSDGTVNLLDYNLLKAGFGTTYNLLNYNQLVQQFGQ